jgi:predicted signal transduction protein with EAL and GGDEF domain
VGDAVLVEVGHRLRTNLRPGDLAARLGGDEFAVLMWARPAEARPVAERLLAVLSRPYEQPTGTVFMSASIGLAGCATADDVPSLLRNADLALRYAKQRGKSRVEQYDAEYERRLVRRTTLEHELRGAIDRDELHLAYQPVVALPSARTAGAEALLRWHHPGLGTIPPDEFIPVAEESGMIVRLGGFVLHRACHQLSLWLAAGHDVWMSVNVSPYELHSPEYVRQVADVLRVHRVPPQRLVLEVTEQVVAPDREELVRRLTALRHTGVRIALDDFGAGYNALGQLRNLPVDILKIDHSLVAELDPSRGRCAKPLVDVVAELGHRLGLEVIAEGVVVPEQRDLVVKAGCRFAQGEMYGRAVPAEHLEAMLAAVQPPRSGPPAQIRRAAAPIQRAAPPIQHVGSVDSPHEMRQA